MRRSARSAYLVRVAVTILVVLLLTAPVTSISGSGQSVEHHPSARSLVAKQTNAEPKSIAALDALSGANFSAAQAINEAGVIVGMSGEIGIDGTVLWQSAVRWDRDGAAPEELESLSSGTTSKAVDINARGNIVGSSQGEDGGQRAVLWEDGVLYDLATLPGGTTSEATAIDDAGQIVGFSTTAPGQTLGEDGTHAFLWIDGEMQDLGALPGHLASKALDLTDDGLVIGSSRAPNGSLHAVAWEAGRIIDLDIAGVALGVNAAGMVTGSFQTKEGRSHAFVRIGDRTVDLGTLQGTDGYGLQINDGGVVVGYSCTVAGCPDGAVWKAVLWRNGLATDLSSLLSDRSYATWILQAAFDINNAGDVVGTGVFGADEPLGGQTRGFVLRSDEVETTFPVGEEE